MSYVQSTVTLSDGAQLNVKLLGGEDSSKPLLIALHGAPGISSHAEPLASFGFLAAKFRVLVYDARGSGISSLQKPYTHERWVADVEELRIWAVAEKIFLAGGSYGGAVALEYAVAHPTRLRALILRGTFAVGVPLMMNALKATLTSPSKRVNPDPERALRVWSGALIDDEDFKRAFWEIQGLFDGPDKAGTSVEFPAPDKKDGGGIDRKVHAETQNAAFSGNLPRYDLRDRLGEIKAPTLVIVGLHDPIAPVIHSAQIADGIEGAQLVVFQRSGHSVPADEKEKFEQVVGDFLAELQ